RPLRPPPRRGPRRPIRPDAGRGPDPRDVRRAGDSKATRLERDSSLAPPPAHEGPSRGGRRPDDAEGTRRRRRGQGRSDGHGLGFPRAPMAPYASGGVLHPGRRALCGRRGARVRPGTVGAAVLVPVVVAAGPYPPCRGSGGTPRISDTTRTRTK